MHRDYIAGVKDHDIQTFEAASQRSWGYSWNGEAGALRNRPRGEKVPAEGRAARGLLLSAAGTAFASVRGGVQASGDVVYEPVTNLAPTG